MEQKNSKPELILELEKEIGRELVEIEISRVVYDNGYAIDKNGNIIGLNLSELGIQTIPPIMVKCSFLSDLNLSKNSITDISIIKNLIKLEILNLNSNNISKISYLEKLIKLKKLFLNFNNITDISVIGKMKKIEWLELVTNRISDISVLYSHENLKILNINVNEISNIFKLLKLLGQSSILERTGIQQNYFPQIQKNFSPSKQLEILKSYSSFLQKNTKPSTFINKEKQLHTCIKGFKFNNFQGIKEIEVSDIPTDTQWIFLTGENGYGKSSLLKAIVISIFGKEDENTLLAKNIELNNSFIEFKYAENNHINKSENPEYFLNFKDFAAYGPSRLNKNPHPHEDKRTNSLFNSYGELRDIEERLSTWEKDTTQNKFYKSARKILLNLLKSQVEDIIIKREGTKTTVLYKEVEENEKSELKKFTELASGYRSIIAMIGDMMIRLSENQPKINSFSELTGIVIIDEFDLHLHPKWQKMLVEKLTELFPKIQFIVSTHSPIPLLGAPANSVILNVNRTKEEGITVEKLDIDFTTLLPNAILTSPIFDFQEIIAKNKSKDKFLRTKTDYNEIQEDEKRRKEISEFLTPEKTEEFLDLLDKE